MEGWHGWQRQDLGDQKNLPSLNIGPLPGRERIALFIANRQAGEIYVAAYFANEELARATMRILDAMLASFMWSDEPEPLFPEAPHGTRESRRVNHDHLA